MPKPAITTFSSIAVKESQTNKDNGFYAPQLTTIQRDAILITESLKEGCIIFNIDEKVFQFFQDSKWVDLNSTTADVVGPNAATDNAIAIFDGPTGKKIKDSGVPITQVPQLAPLLFSAKNNNNSVNEIGNLGHIKFVNDLGIIFVDSLIPLEFITNNIGSDDQVCSLFTGGLPSTSSSPSALVELQSTTGVFLFSRLNQTQIDALVLPVAGMSLYNKDINKLIIYTPIGWLPLLSTDINGNLDLENKRIINAAEPIDDTDGATKNFVEISLSSATISLTGEVTGSGSLGTPITTTVTSVNPSAILNYPNSNSVFLRGDGTWTDSLNGNFGLSDSNPSTKLSVVGNTQIGFTTGTTAPVNGLAVNGFVGIGTNSPTSQLEVNGTSTLGNITVNGNTVSTTSGDILFNKTWLNNQQPCTIFRRLGNDPQFISELTLTTLDYFDQNYFNQNSNSITRVSISGQTFYYIGTGGLYLIIADLLFIKPDTAPNYCDVWIEKMTEGVRHGETVYQNPAATPESTVNVDCRFQISTILPFDDNEYFRIWFFSTFFTRFPDNPGKNAHLTIYRLC